jgi:hypothetical protein
MMKDPRRRRRDAGLATVARWTRGAVAGGVVLAGVLSAGLAHLLPGQAAPVRPDTPPSSAPPGTDDPVPSSAPAGPRHSLTSPGSPPHRSHGHPHATSGGS